MVNINPNRESCMEYMKELIRKGLTESEVIKECIKGFTGVHKIVQINIRYLFLP